MKTISDQQGFLASIAQLSTRHSCLALPVVGILAMNSTARASPTECDPIYDPITSYATLSRSAEPIVDGQDGVFFYLLDDRALVEHDDACLYEIEETTVEIEFGTLAEVTLVFELPDYAAGATVHVTEHGMLLETLVLESNSFTYVLAEDSELGFEISVPGLPAPTVPVVITKPTTDDPEPV